MMIALLKPSGSESRFLVCLVVLLALPGFVRAEGPQWTGKGRCRLLVKVAPIELGEREADELVARCAVDFPALMKTMGIDGSADLSTLQVHRYEPTDGNPEAFQPFDNAASPYDRPCRFDDQAVPWDYPDRANYASDQKERRGPITIRKGGGRLFNREKDATTGHVVWVHTQRGNQPSHYAIYWDAAPAGVTVTVSPSPWVGDVDVLRRKEGQPLGGLSHFTLATGDFNGDGLFDLFAGAEKGDLMWFPNRGKPGEPRFIGCRMLTDEEGPIDCGWYAAPFLYDWDNDGLLDLLAGTSHNVILWWKNVGARTEPRLSYRGYVQSQGKKLEVPQSPVPEDTASIFARDYYNQPWVGDWDGDGLPDLLTGGYTTGLIFHYRAAGRESDGVPILEYVGPIEADGEPIDTVWAAAPTAGDFNGDGKPDLITGSWFWSGIARPRQPGEADYLMHYRNAGTTAAPQLKRAPFPIVGTFAGGAIARASLADWNADGLIDLVVSDSGGSVYPWLNVGTKSDPRWDNNSESLTLPWGFVRDFGFSGWGETTSGEKLLVSGQTLSQFTGSPYSPRMVRKGGALVDGKRIEHPGPGYGDDYYFTTLHDWDQDERLDLLWGTHQGEVYIHRAIGAHRSFEFAPGVRLTLKDGSPLRVGPQVVDSPSKATDFTILQGSRIILIADDFDGDGIDDLAVTETYGNVWIFRNTKSGGLDTFEAGVKVGKVAGGGRSDDLHVVDFNEDGKPDLIMGQTTAKPGMIFINRSTPGQPRFDEPIQPLDLPFVFWGANFYPTDWNRDGDEDFLIQSEFYTFWLEKSFLKHGYQDAVAVSSPEGRLKREGDGG